MNIISISAYLTMEFIFHKMMKRVLSFLKRQHLYLGIVRYSLAILMFPYALTKILRTQFVLSGFTFTQTQTLESLASTQLTWAFLGYSAWFQILLGFLELIPAILLLFRRTVLLGAILMLPITLNVFLMNYALQLWDGTKLIASILLGLNFLVLALKWKRVKSLFLMIAGKGLSIKFTGIEIAINLTVMAIVVYFASQPLMEYQKQTNVLTGDWLNQRPAEWILRKEQSSDSTLTPRELKLYFGPYGQLNEVGDANMADKMSYTIDTNKLKLALNYDGKIVNCSYELIGETGLKIERPADTAKHTKLVQYYEKRTINGARN